MTKTEAVIKLGLETISLDKQALVFVNSKRSAEKTAEEIAKKIKNVELKKFSDKILKTLSNPTRQCQRLAECVTRGIAFHHAGLAAEQREFIEDKFREGKIKIICATPTLAFGLDLPAFRAIIKDLRRFTPRGLQWIPVLEYLQQSGRAGRPKFDSFGESIAIAKTSSEKKKIKEQYIEGEPEEIYSKLAVEPVLRTYLLSLISSGFVNSEKEIFNFFEKTFWAHQYEDMEELKYKIRSMLGLLEKFEFIKYNEEKESYTATIIGERVSQLYIDPLTANFMIKNIKKKTDGDDFAILQLVSYTLEMRPLLRTRKSDEFVEDELIEREEDLLFKVDEWNMNYPHFLNSIKTGLFFLDWVNEKTEDYLMEKYSIRPGEVRAKLNLCDWLLYALEELCKLGSNRDIISDVIKLRLRLKYGAKEELLPLLRLKGIGRVRARKMFRNGIKNLRDLKSVKMDKLSMIVGKNVALNVKEQIGQNKKGGLKGGLMGFSMRQGDNQA